MASMFALLGVPFEAPSSAMTLVRTLGRWWYP
jgi:hypothetical protein